MAEGAMATVKNMLAKATPSVKPPKSPKGKPMDEEKRKLQNSEAAKRFRQKRKRAEGDLKLKHELLKQSSERMIGAIIRLKAICQTYKVKIPDLGLEEGDIDEKDTEGDTDALTTAGGKKSKKSKGGKAIDIYRNLSVGRGLDKTIRETETRLSRKLRAIQTQLDEIQGALAPKLDG